MVFKESMNIKPITKALQFQPWISIEYDTYCPSKLRQMLRIPYSTTYTAVDWSLLLRHYVS